MLVMVVAIGFCSCSNKDAGAEKDTAGGDKSDNKVTVDEKEKDDKPKNITLKFLSNLPDRTSGQGKLEQTLIDNYKKDNPNVTIEVEALQDEPYKQKFKAYTSSNSLADIYHIWGQPAFFAPVMKEGYAAELNPDDYKDYGFFPGALDGFSYDGKLYGLPRNTDVMVLFYNKGLFEKYKVKVPENYKDLIDAAKAFRAKGIAPCAMCGKDKWPIGILYQDLCVKVSGNQKLIYDAISRKTSFAGEEDLIEGAKLLKGLMDNKFFQDAFTASDYGAANNLFAQEKAAMYYMGSWEMGMVSNDKFPESFRENMAVMRFPVVEGGKGKATDVIAWNGGGYAVSPNSKEQEEAKKFLNYMFKPENWSKNAWQLGVCIPAQKYNSFLTGQETEVQKELTKMLGESTSISGTPWFDSATPSFKTDGENLSQELAAGVKTPEQFIAECDKAAEKAVEK